MNTMTFNPVAVGDFERAMLKASWRDWLSRLTRRHNDLLSLDEVRGHVPLKGQHYLGLQIVSLDKIVGSEGHHQDFDRAFFPRQMRSKERWIRIDQAHYAQTPLPPVELAKIDDMYFVRDGNHRVSVARARGQDFIDAYVTEIEASVPAELPTVSAKRGS